MPIRSDKKLTKTTAKEAKPKDRPYFIWCKEMTGFGMRTYPNGRKVYYVRYRVTKGQHAKRVFSIGEYGQISVDKARDIATIELAKACAGQDPAKQRKEYEKAITVAELCSQYLDAANKGLILGKNGRPKAGTTINTDVSRIHAHIIPLLGKKKVNELKQTDIIKFMRDVTNGETAKKEKTKKQGQSIVRGGAGAARRTVGMLGGILSYAISIGIITANPVHGVKRSADRRRDRRLLPNEYRIIGRLLERSKENSIPEQAVAGIWLLLLTGCRLKEIVELKWSEIDDEDKYFRFTNTKEGASIRPIGEKALDILDLIEPKESCPFVLASSKGRGHYGGLVGIWNRHFRTIPQLKDVTIHTMRHSFASVAADLGHPDTLVAAFLGHSTGTITSRYVHRLADTVTNAANMTANEVYSYMTKDQTATSGRQERLQKKIQTLSMNWLDSEGDNELEQIALLEKKLKQKTEK